MLELCGFHHNCNCHLELTFHCQTTALTALMICTEVRLVFINSSGIGYISRYLHSKKNPSNRKMKKGNDGEPTQQLHVLCFCVWIMSYDCNANSAVRLAFARDNAV